MNNNLNNNINNNYNNIIDERIAKVCENAENEYSQRHSKRNNNSINNDNQIVENGNSLINNPNYYINNNKNNYINNQNINNPISKYNNTQEDDQNLYLSQSYSKIAKINNKSLDTDINVLSKIKLGLQNKPKTNNTQLNSNNNYTNINSPFHKDSDNYTKKLALYNLNQNNVNKNKDKDKENKLKTDLSKILLEARDLIKKLKIKQAYILLKKTILTNIQHSDLFYLYGEINRLIKQYKTAEFYLLKAIKFELHSPYVFYSLGLLYQELKEYQNSNKFFVLFYRLMNNADLHFQMGLNYFCMKNYVNAADELTKAIELNEECAEYYQFRSEIYKKMGLKQMEDEDFRMYWFITQKRKEEE